MFPTAARVCPFAIHSCIVRTSEVRSAGGFDESLMAVRRLGSLAANRPPRSAVRPGGGFPVLLPHAPRLGVDRRRADAGRWAARHHPGRMARTLASIQDGAAWPDGLPQVDLARTRLGFCCWPAGLAISNGDDPVELLAAVAGDRSPEVDPSTVADALFRSIPLRSCRGPEAWIELWPVFQPALARFIDALEQHSGTPRLRARTMAILERLVLEHSPDPAQFGRTAPCRGAGCVARDRRPGAAGRRRAGVDRRQRCGNAARHDSNCRSATGR